MNRKNFALNVKEYRPAVPARPVFTAPTSYSHIKPPNSKWVAPAILAAVAILGAAAFVVFHITTGI